MRTISLAIVLIALGLGVAAAQDMGIPDSAYFRGTSYQPDGCTRRMNITAPVYLFTDDCCQGIGFQFVWEPGIDFDTVTIRHPYIDSFPDFALMVNAESRLGHLVIHHADSFACVHPPTGVFAELKFTADLLDAVQVGVPSPESFIMLEPFEPWSPSYQHFDIDFVLPDTIIVSPGDANSAGEPPSDIDDIVYLLEYVFAGGCPPWDLNSGDANGSCYIDIDDIVYLINVMFGGDPPPMHGCVVQ
jgi:hypothetical protein